MPNNDFRCPKCATCVEDSPRNLHGEDCPSGVCHGKLRRVWAFYLKPVDGGGGSKGHYTGGK